MNNPNDPKNWSIELCLRGDELNLILDALEEFGKKVQSNFSDPNEIKEIHAITHKLDSKWESTNWVLNLE